MKSGKESLREWSNYSLNFQRQSMALKYSIKLWRHTPRCSIMQTVIPLKAKGNTIIAITTIKDQICRSREDLLLSSIKLYQIKINSSIISIISKWYQKQETNLCTIITKLLFLLKAISRCNTDPNTSSIKWNQHLITMFKVQSISKVFEKKDKYIKKNDVSWEVYNIDLSVY